MTEDNNRRVTKSAKKKGVICVTRKRAQKHLKKLIKCEKNVRERYKSRSRRRRSHRRESQKEAESQKEEERQERRICLSTQTQAQRQVLEEMIPLREGQGADITCGITVAVDAYLKGGDVFQHSHITCSVTVDAYLKGGGATQHSHSTCSVTVDASLKGGGATQHSRNTCGFAVDASLKGGGGNPALRR